MEKGKQEGIEIGREEGREDGQQQASIRIAQSLLDVITDDELLAKKTGLTIAEVVKLREYGIYYS